MQKIRARYRTCRIWLLGGAALAQSFDQLDLINEAIVTIIPTELHEGVPLGINFMRLDRWEVVDTRSYKGGITQNHYRQVGCHRAH